jgi:transcriptional regulator with XRE-family HTH domain
MAPKDDWQARLREAFVGTKLSMRALSEKAGFSPTYVSALLRGEIDKRGPSANSLRRIAVAAGVDPDWIITGKRQPRSARAARGAKAAVSGKVPAGGAGRPNEERYPERHRALVLLRPHLEGDGGRVRDYLLTLAGTPYDAWAASDWLAEAERVRETVLTLDAVWGGNGRPRQPEARGKAKRGRAG